MEPHKAINYKESSSIYIADGHEYTTQARRALKAVFSVHFSRERELYKESLCILYVNRTGASPLFPKAYRMQSVSIKTGVSCDQGVK